ncbi:MAG: hypothetical protein QOG96_5200 [Pseudonocardiales bacterium]|nr:hypothetical protein [Pseudonocardiales bacterium]
MVVTGANRGLGLEVVRQCAADGDTVLLGSRDLAAGERAAAELAAAGVPTGRVLPVELDVTDATGLVRLAARLTGELGLDRIDVLVNNAAVHYDTWQNAATDMGGAGGRPVALGAASIRYAMDLPDGGPTSTFTRDGRPIPW